MVEGSLYLVALDQGVAGVVADNARTLGRQTILVESTDEFLAKYVRDGHGCVVADTTRGPAPVYDLLREMSLAGPWPMPVVVAMADADVPSVVEMMRHGATTIVPLPSSPEGWCEEIGYALEHDAGRTVRRQAMLEARRQMSQLVADEKHIVTLIMEGNTNREIAELLEMGLRTVEKRRNGILVKLAVDSVPALVRLVVTSGLKMKVNLPKPEVAPPAIERHEPFWPAGRLVR